MSLLHVACLAWLAVAAPIAQEEESCNFQGTGQHVEATLKPHARSMLIQTSEVRSFGRAGALNHSVDLDMLQVHRALQADRLQASRASSSHWVYASEPITSMSEIYAIDRDRMRYRELRHAAPMAVALAEDEEGEGKPSLFQVAKIVAIFLVCLGFLDIMAHLADRYIEDPTDRLKADHFIDSAASIAVLVVSFLAYGITQEFIMTTEYNGESFPSAAYLILCNRIFLVLFAGTAILATGQSIDMGAAKLASLPGCLGLICSYTEESALLFLTFPVIAVFRSSKLVPTMLVNGFVNSERHTIKDYAMAVVICLGVCGFVISNKKGGGGESASSGAYIGIILMFLGLTGDAFEVAIEKRVFDSFPKFGHMQMMFVTGLYGMALILVIVCATSGFGPLISFLANNPECKYHMLMLSLCATTGVYAIFYIIDHQGPVPLQIALVFKQVMAILLSSVLYQHPLSPLAMCFAGLTVAAVMFKPLYKLFGPADDKPPKIGGMRGALCLTSKAATALGWERQMRTSVRALQAAARFRRPILKKDSHREEPEKPEAGAAPVAN